jgi:hypothetical protein
MKKKNIAKYVSDVENKINNLKLPLSVTCLSHKKKKKNLDEALKNEILINMKLKFALF